MIKISATPKIQRENKIRTITKRASSQTKYNTLIAKITPVVMAIRL